jgi:hypothetical protein
MNIRCGGSSIVKFPFIFIDPFKGVCQCNLLSFWIMSLYKQPGQNLNLNNDINSGHRSLV